MKKIDNLTFLKIKALVVALDNELMKDKKCDISDAQILSLMLLEEIKKVSNESEV